MFPQQSWLLFGCFFLGIALLLPAKAEEKPYDPDEEILREAKLSTNSADLLAYLRQHCGDDTELLQIDALIRQLQSDQPQQRLEAAKKLKTLGPAALAKLRDAATDAAGPVAQCADAIDQAWKPWHSWAAVRLLVRQAPVGVEEALVRFLPYAGYEDLEVEIWYGLYDLVKRSGKVSPVLLDALQDRVAARRALASFLIGRVGNHDERAEPKKLLADPSPVVRLRAAQGLLAAKDPAGLPTLIHLLDQPQVTLAWQAEELLHYAAGNQGPATIVGAGAAAERQKCQAGWQQWWKKEGATFNPGKLDQDNRRPGLRLVVGSPAPLDEDALYDVWVSGCDGKPRWQLKGLDPVADAHILPGDKVLLAQHPRLRRNRKPPFDEEVLGKPQGINVRNFAGQVLRSDGMNDRSVLLCQLLPNGNLAVTSGNYLDVLSPALTRRTTIRAIGVELPDSTNKGVEGPVLLPSGRWLVRAEGFDRKHLDLYECGPEPRDLRPVRRIRIADKVHEFHSSKYVQPLPDGTFMLYDGLGHVIEVDATGKTVWRSPVDTLLFTSPGTRMRDGNRMILGESRIVEIDAGRKVVWEAIDARRVQRLREVAPLVRLGFDFQRAWDLDSAVAIAERVKGLISKETATRHATTRLIATTLGPKALPAAPLLIDLLDDPDRGVRDGAEEALKAIGPDVVPQLVAALRDRRARLRYIATYMLGGFPEQARLIIPGLREAARDDVPQVRSSAVYTLAFFGKENKDALVTVIKALHDKDTTDTEQLSVRSAALIGLANLGAAAKDAVPALTSLLASTDPNMTGMIIGTLGKIGPPARAALPAISKVLGTATNPISRANAAEAIGTIGHLTDQGHAALKSALSDKDPSVRAAAQAALKKLTP